MLLDGAQRAGEVDILFLYATDANLPSEARSALEADLGRYWQIRARIFTCESGSEPSDRALPTRILFRARCLVRGAVTFSNELFPRSDTSFPPQVQALERCLERAPDAIIAHRLGAMAPLLMSRRALPPIFLDLDDVDHVKAYRFGWRARDLRRRLRLLASVPALLWSEIRAIDRSYRTFVCSEVDRQRFARLAISDKVCVVPNAVTIPPVAALPPEPTLLFLGTYIYPPNVEAVEWLLADIWPRIIRALPSARLLIGGPHPDRIPSYQNAPVGVEFLGFVEDLGELYRRCRVVCCPIRAGAGTRIKIIEAAAFGRPVVATAIGNEGLELRDGHEVLLRDDAGGFAEACVELLTDTTLCERLAGAARVAVRQRYDRASIVATIRDNLKQALP
jgi:glycosyltransferase involved in cell wall biosynthesis